MVAAGTGTNGGFADKVNVQLGTASDTETRSVWYFEPADEGNISAAPKNGKIYRIRTRHSGQYVCPLRVAAGQKVRQGHSYLGGNMTSRTEHAYTTGTPGAATKTDTFTYGNTAWKDQLTAYNGTPITYDGGGNPLQYRGMTFTWQRGRQLQSVTKEGVTTTFQYDAQGRRISRTTGGTTTEYYYNGSTLTALKKGNDLVQFVYDANGRPVFMRVNGTTEYAYLYNGQGDVTGLVDSGNNLVVSYEYDSWGKVVNTTDTSGVGIGSINPFRYRGYVYDAECALYAIASRFFDAETERFLNADAPQNVITNRDAFIEKNLYAYCNNNPVNYFDVGGEFALPNWAKLAIGLAVMAGGIAVFTAAGEVLLQLLQLPVFQKKYFCMQYMLVLFLPVRKELLAWQSQCFWEMTSKQWLETLSIQRSMASAMGLWQAGLLSGLD